MMQLGRLVYASKAVKDNSEVRSDLMDILTEAIRFNREQQIFGVLYYGHGYFLQCLEGDMTKIKKLYDDRLLSDPRHTDTILLSLDVIEQILFSEWNMKFAPYNEEIMRFFQQENNLKFNPYLLNQTNIPHFLKLLSVAA